MVIETSTARRQELLHFKGWDTDVGAKTGKGFRQKQELRQKLKSEYCLCGEWSVVLNVVVGDGTSRRLKKSPKNRV